MECHNITENNSIFFKNNTVKSCIGLTATPPTDFTKQRLLSDILKVNVNKNEKGKWVIYPTYEVTLDQAVEMELIAPYDITIVTMSLDDKDKYIKKEYKDKKTGKMNTFFQTEFKNYVYLTQQVEYGSNPLRQINRMRFIYTLKSKTEAAKKILENVIPKDRRTLIFCGSKVQANQVCEYRYYSKPSKPKIPAKLKGSFDTATNQFEIAAVNELKEYHTYLRKLSEYAEAIKYYQGNESFEKFINKEITQLACVDALNEGHNIPDVDIAFIIQLNAQELDLKQRMGRILRARDGHIGKIIILTTEYTVDADWVTKATKSLDNTKIRTIKLEDLRTGKETINFN